MPHSNLPDHTAMELVNVAKPRGKSLPQTPVSMAGGVSGGR